MENFCVLEGRKNIFLSTSRSQFVLTRPVKILKIGQQMEAGKLGLVPTRPLSQLGLGSTRPGQLGLFIFLMVNWDITYMMYLLRSVVDLYDLEYAR